MCVLEICLFQKCAIEPTWNKFHRHCTMPETQQKTTQKSCFENSQNICANYEESACSIFEFADDHICNHSHWSKKLGTPTPVLDQNILLRKARTKRWKSKRNESQLWPHRNSTARWMRQVSTTSQLPDSKMPRKKKSGHLFDLLLVVLHNFNVACLWVSFTVHGWSVWKQRRHRWSLTFEGSLIKNSRCSRRSVCEIKDKQETQQNLMFDADAKTRIETKPRQKFGHKNSSPVWRFGYSRQSSAQDAHFAT